MTGAYSSIDLREFADAPYERVSEAFEWEIPKEWNVGRAICDVHSETGRTALRYRRGDGGTVERSFGDIDRRASSLAGWLHERGTGRGDRIGIALPQRIETLVSHVATYKLGAIAVPTSVLTGTDELRYRLNKADVSALIAAPETVDAVDFDAVDLETCLVVGATDEHDRWIDALESGDSSFETRTTSAEDPCMITFTSGTTGHPKGVVHAHRCLAPYHLGFEVMAEFPGDDAVVFTPADWAWIAGTFDTTFPAWYNGQTVVGYESDTFVPSDVFELLETYGVTHSLFTPTMLRMMKGSPVSPESYDLDLDVVITGGEPSSMELFEWIDDAFSGVTLNEHFGQTEADLLTTNSAVITGRRRTSVGRPIPGHEVAIIDDTGERLPAGETGRIAVASPDPAIMLEYWDEPEKTDEAFIDGWLDTGDLGYRDEDGFFWFAGRGDELIVSSGYRISPVEVERKIEEHEDVRDAVVFATSDERRGTVVTAAVDAAPERDEDELREEIVRLVKTEKAKYKYPRRIEFVDGVPRTSTNKTDRESIKRRFDGE